MRKVLITPAHYLLDYTSRSEFYFAGKLIHDLAEKTPDTEYYVICGKCANPMPKNVFLYELQRQDGAVELNMGSRIAFYLRLLFTSTRLSFSHRFDVMWHLFPNGRFSFNPFFFFKINSLLNPRAKKVIGRLQYAKHDIHHRLDKFHLDSMHMHTVQPDRVTTFLQKTLFKVLGIFSNYYFNLFDLLIFNNESARSHYFQYAISSFKRVSTIIPVAIDRYQFPFKRKILGNKLELLYAGILDKNKRVGEVLRICQGLQKQNAPFHLSIVGDGELRQELESQAADLLRKDRYTFFGNVPKKDMNSFFEKTHFLFSLSASESFGQVFAESWSTGTVFIGSDIPVYAEVIRDKENGLLYSVEGNNPDRLAETIARIDQVAFDKIADTAREESKRYDWATVIEQYEKALGTD